jgi:hypothetical protein
MHEALDVPEFIQVDSLYILVYYRIEDIYSAVLGEVQLWCDWWDRCPWRDPETSCWVHRWNNRKGPIKWQPYHPMHTGMLCIHQSWICLYAQCVFCHPACTYSVNHCHSVGSFLYIYTKNTHLWVNVVAWRLMLWNSSSLTIQNHMQVRHPLMEWNVIGHPLISDLSSRHFLYFTFAFSHAESAQSTDAPFSCLHFLKIVPWEQPSVLETKIEFVHHSPVK